jgi:GxxExxY protein
MSKNNVEDFLYEEESYKIRGACFEVYNNFGGAFKESIVDRALTESLKKRELNVEEQKRIDIYFSGKKVGTYVPDKVVNDIILLEVKAKQFITNEDKKQVWYYLKGSKYKLGFLINFSPLGLDIKRIIYDKAKNQRKSA